MKCAIYFRFGQITEDTKKFKAKLERRNWQKYNIENLVEKAKVQNEWKLS